MGCDFILLHQYYKTDADGNYLVGQDGRVQIQRDVVGRATTGSDGVAGMDLNALRLPDTGGPITLVLGQEFKEAIRDFYKPLENRWYVTIERNEWKEYVILSVTRAPAMDAPAPFPEDLTEESPDVTVPETSENVREYDPETQTLTVVNEALLGIIGLKVLFNGFDGAVPAEMKSIVTVTGPNDFEEQLELQVNEYGFYLIEGKLTDVPMGEYEFSVSDPVSVEGYTAASPTIQIRCPVEKDPELTNTVILKNGQQNAEATIIYDYVSDTPATDPTDPTEGTDPTDPSDPTEGTDPTDPSDPTESTDPTSPTTKPGTSKPMSNTIVAKAMDDLERNLIGTEIALYSGKDQICKWQSTYENIFVLDDLEKYGVANDSVTYTLKQSRAPAGYRLSGDAYTIKISNYNGKTEVDVKKNTGALEGLFKGNGIEVGSDGKQIVTFRNTRKTAQIQLTSHVEVLFGENSWVDESLVKSYREQKQTFMLTWENAKGEQQTETITLKAGETGQFEAEVPFDTKYEVTLVDGDGSFVAEFSEKSKGRVESTDLKEPIPLEVTQLYKVEPGVGLEVSLVKVDAQTKLPLQGVSFDLKDPQGEVVASCTSDEDGEMILAEVFHVPGTYLLEETATLENYQLLAEAVPIQVKIQYTLDNATGEPILLQTLTAEISHKAVVAESDGSYWVENEPAPQEEPVVEEDDGFSFGPLIIGLVVLAVAGVAVFLILRKRRQSA